MDSKGLCGLINYGNTCYLNSAIQCLMATDVLTQFFLDNKFDKPNNIMTHEWSKLVEGFYEENCTISPLSFYKRFIQLSVKKNLDFRVSSQNDVQEFLIFLIDQFHEEIKKKVIITISGKIINDNDKLAFQAMKEWRNFFKDNYSKIIDIFYGQLVSQISIMKNNKLHLESTTYSPICFFSLPIPDNETCNIFDCFDLFTKDNILENDSQWKCDKTNKYYDGVQNVKVWKFPDILIINFKRFDNYGRKINKLIDFPIYNLDLNKYCIGYHKYKSKFELYGICNHVGNLNFGHYYAYCKNGNNWYNFNDDSISMIDEDKIVNNNAYCLFYKKIK